MARFFRFGGGVPKSRRGGQSPYGGDQDFHSTQLGTATFVIDASDMTKLMKALRESGEDMPKIMMWSFNRGLDKLYTGTKGMLKEVTGIRKVGRITQDMKKIPASKGSLGSMTTITLVVRGNHTRVSRGNYGARWGGVHTPGATHSAWGRAQTATGAFMIAGKQPIFKRTSNASLPIRPLWGPNMAREMDRNQGRVRKLQAAVWQSTIKPEAMRLLDVHIRKKKAKYGL